MVRVNRKTDLSLWIVNEIIQVIYRKIINKRETNCTEYIARYKAKLVNCKRGYEPIIRSPSVFFRIEKLFYAGIYFIRRYILSVCTR